jgi:hypothetical protein
MHKSNVREGSEHGKFSVNFYQNKSAFSVPFYRFSHTISTSLVSQYSARYIKGKKLHVCKFNMPSQFTT